MGVTSCKLHRALIFQAQVRCANKTRPLSRSAQRSATPDYNLNGHPSTLPLAIQVLLFIINCQHYIIAVAIYLQYTVLSTYAGIVNCGRTEIKLGLFL